MRRYRVYFNRHQDAPFVWSYDEGPGTPEHNVKSIRMEDALLFSEYDPEKRGSKDFACAWFTVFGKMHHYPDGHVVIRG